MLLLGVCFATGCQPIKETRFDILSFKDGPQSQLFTESFENGYFCIGANKNWMLAFEVVPSYIEPMEDSADDGNELSPANGDTAAEESELPVVPLRMSQTLVIEVFWRARPGRTFTESSQTNANIVYCLTAGRESISYEGAGFVSFKLARDGKTLTGRIESSALYPVRIVGAPADLLGPCRLTGTFIAREDKARTVALQQTLRKRLGPPSGTTSAITSVN